LEWTLGLRHGVKGVVVHAGPHTAVRRVKPASARRRPSVGTGFARAIRSLTDGSSWASPLPIPPAGQRVLVFCRDQFLSPLIYDHSLRFRPSPLAWVIRSADSCPALERLTKHPVTQYSMGRSPAVSSTAFCAQPLDLSRVRSMEMSFAIICSLAPHRRPHYPVLVHRLAPLLITSPPSGCEGTSTSKLSIVLGTHKKGPVRSRALSIYFFGVGSSAGLM
jgi:hypothetical protein